MSTPLPSQSASGSNTSNVGLSTLSLVAVVSLVAAPFAVLMLDHYATRSRLRHIYEFAILASMVILPMVQEREPTQDPQGPHGSISTELSELINNASLARAMLVCNFPWRTAEVRAAMSEADKDRKNLYRYISMACRDYLKAAPNPQHITDKDQYHTIPTHDVPSAGSISGEKLC